MWVHFPLKNTTNFRSCQRSAAHLWISGGHVRHNVANWTIINRWFLYLSGILLAVKNFIQSNISWLYGYFDKNKSLLEIFSFLMVAQSFIYSAQLQDIGTQSIAAFKIVLWIMIFLIILLLQISTVVELKRDGDKVFGTIFEGANFMKTVMRLLTLVLLLASVPIFIKQIQTSVHNSLFSIFYGSLALAVILEVLTFTITRVMRKNALDLRKWCPA